MEPPLTRTASSDSTRSWQHLTTASGTSVAGQKARSSEAETGIATVERASVSLPPLGAKAIRQSLPVRRASKASDSSLIEYFGSVWSGSAIDETDATPTLESTRGSLASAPVNHLLLPESYRHARPDVGTAAVESKRLSVSSFVSAISNRAYSWSGRSSVAGSEADGTSCVRQCTRSFPHAHASARMLTLHSENGEPARHHDGNHVALRHHVEPEWQSRHQGVADANALPPRSTSKP